MNEADMKMSKLPTPPVGSPQSGEDPTADSSTLDRMLYWPGKVREPLEGETAFWAAGKRGSG